jgi:hypothetical protein
MKRIFRIPALIFGLVAVSAGTTSCGDDDEPSVECCSFSYTYENGDSYTLTACADGTYTYNYSYADGTTGTESGRWDDDPDYTYTWGEIRAEILEEDGATCN